MSLEAQFEPLEIIGRGSFGQIRKVRRLSDGKILARKEISYRTMNVKEKNQLMAEFRILKSLVHPNIVQYYYHDHVVAEHAVHLYMEYCDGGDLGGVIRTCKSTGEFVPESLVWSVFTQLTLALYRCHYNSDPPAAVDLFSTCSNISAGVINGSINIMNVTDPSFAPPTPSTVILHRDIKPDNVFLDKFNTVKLGDFGLAKILDQEHFMTNTYVGTPYYMSPEVLNDQPFTPQSDVWSLGCVIYELCAKHPPFQAKTHMQLSQKIREGTYPPLHGNYSQTLAKTIAACLNQNSRLRPTTAALLHLDAMNLCRRERAVEGLRRELEAAQSEAGEEMRQREQMLVAKEEDLAAKEQILMGQEEQFLHERESIMSQAQHMQQEQEQQQLAMMHSINDEFNMKVEQEVQRRLEAIQAASPQKHSIAATSNSSSPASSTSTPASYDMPDASPAQGSTVASYLASPTDVVMTSAQNTPYTTRSPIKGPRTIRDVSYGLSARTPCQKQYSYDDMRDGAGTRISSTGKPAAQQRPISTPSLGMARHGQIRDVSNGSSASSTSYSSSGGHAGGGSPHLLALQQQHLDHRGSSHSLAPKRSPAASSPPPVRKARSAVPVGIHAVVRGSVSPLISSPSNGVFGADELSPTMNKTHYKAHNMGYGDGGAAPPPMAPHHHLDVYKTSGSINMVNNGTATSYNDLSSSSSASIYSIQSSGFSNSLSSTSSASFDNDGSTATLQSAQSGYGSYHQPIVLEDAMESLQGLDVDAVQQMSPSKPGMYAGATPGMHKVVKKPFSPIRNAPRDRQPPHYQAIYEVRSNSPVPTTPVTAAGTPVPATPKPLMKSLRQQQVGSENYVPGGSGGRSVSPSPHTPSHYTPSAQRKALLPNMNLHNNNAKDDDDGGGYDGQQQYRASPYGGYRKTAASPSPSPQQQENAQHMRQASWDGRGGVYENGSMPVSSLKRRERRV